MLRSIFDFRSKLEERPDALSSRLYEAFGLLSFKYSTCLEPKLHMLRGWRNSLGLSNSEIMINMNISLLKLYVDNSPDSLRAPRKIN